MLVDYTEHCPVSTSIIYLMMMSFGIGWKIKKKKTKSDYVNKAVFKDL